MQDLESLEKEVVMGAGNGRNCSRARRSRRPRLGAKVRAIKMETAPAAYFRGRVTRAASLTFVEEFFNGPQFC